MLSMLVLVSKIRSTFKRSPKLSQIKNIVNIGAKQLPNFSSESFEDLSKNILRERNFNKISLLRVVTEF